MSPRAKLLTLIAAVAVAVAAFIALKPGGGDGPPSTSISTRSSMTTTVHATAPAEQVVRRTLTVDSNGPVGGVAEIAARAGERVYITVKSTGYSGEVHLHGFDIKRDVAPGKPASFSITGAQTKSPSGQGSFEMELEAIAVQIAKLQISP